MLKGVDLGVQGKTVNCYSSKMQLCANQVACSKIMGTCLLAILNVYIATKYP